MYLIFGFYGLFGQRSTAKVAVFRHRGIDMAAVHALDGFHASFFNRLTGFVLVDPISPQDFIVDIPPC